MITTMEVVAHKWRTVTKVMMGWNLPIPLLYRANIYTTTTREGGIKQQ